VARKTRSLNASSLKSSGEALADTAVNTWNSVASTIEDVAARAQSVTSDAQGSVRGATKSARKARKNAQKQLTDARKTVKGARRETARRTNAARDALAGRKPRRGWTTFLTVIGVGIGAILGAAGARMAKRDADGNRLDGSVTTPPSPARPDVNRMETDLADAVNATKVPVPPSKPIPTSSPVVPAQPTAAGSVNGSVTTSSKPADKIG
jgi:ElaB/YqjD/DUF883 family membrane-anchored ribosome-binding protein